MGALALAALVSCSDEEDILPQQQEKIVSYLTRSHTPTLLSEQDAAQSLDNDPPYYSTFGNTTYRYIADVYDEERLTRPEVSEGSRVELTFSLYDFTAYSTPKPNECLYSNDTTIINRLVEGGLNPLGGVRPLRSAASGRVRAVRAAQADVADRRRGDAQRVAGGARRLPRKGCRGTLHDL